ncbi:hypothetical protein TNCV_1596201 [Trichonephila clavipes]|nr:hypothetical protein TNCV_1596201 [Trichonephila clavipes]
MSVDQGTSSELQPLRHRQSERVDPLGSGLQTRFHSFGVVLVDPPTSHMNLNRTENKSDLLRSEGRSQQKVAFFYLRKLAARKLGLEAKRKEERKI